MTGRPTTYSQEMLETARDYSAHSQNYEDIVPSVAGLSLVLNVSRQTLYNWGKEYPAFLDMLDSLQAKQEAELIQNGLTSVFNPMITKLMLAKHGYAEKQELTGSNGTPLFDAETKEKANGAIAAILPAGDPQ